MKIANREIGPGFSPYIIAEISANHGGSVEEGFKLLKTAKELGADACKIQCYTANGMTYPHKEKIEWGPWAGETLHDLYKKAETPPQMVRELFAYARKHKITLFSSVFDFSGVDLMVELKSPAIKIASFELVDIPLIQYAAKTSLPMIISTGMSTNLEIIEAINAYTRFSTNPRELGLLHCISNYPASSKEANLPALGPLASLLGGRHVVGFSDHTLGVGSAAAAVAFGACIIEKHFILSRDRGGPDSGFSMEPAEFGRLVVACKEAWEAIQHSPPPQVPVNRQYRKSLFVTKDVCSGEPFSERNVGILRPATGLAPKFYATVLGGSATRDLQAGTPLQPEMVSSLC